MIKAEQIPEEVWKTLRREIEGSGLRHWHEIVAAALNAWPGMELDEAMWSGGTNFIVLPLTQENSDEH